MIINKVTGVLAALLLTGLSGCNNTHSVATPTAHPVIDPAAANQNATVAHTNATHPSIGSTDSSSNNHTNTSQAHTAHQPTWGYTGDKGPDFWGNVVGNEQCKIGNEQSPINIVQVLVDKKMAPKSMFVRSDVEVTNNGHTIVYTPQDANNTSIIDGEIYTLKQFHYHTPSEHQVSGVNYPAELHFVHSNKDGNLAVIGVMLNPTATEPTLQSLAEISVTASSSDSDMPTMVKGLNLSELLPADTGFYHYEGSLTTPPCSEKVQWYVASRPLSVSMAELVTLTQLYSGNNRPIQSQGERPVTLLK